MGETTRKRTEKQTGNPRCNAEKVNGENQQRMHREYMRKPPGLGENPGKGLGVDSGQKLIRNCNPYGFLLRVRCQSTWGDSRVKVRIRGTREKTDTVLKLNFLINKQSFASEKFSYKLVRQLTSKCFL